MQVSEKNIQTKDFSAGQHVLTLHGNPLITKKRDIPKEERPRMYLKVRKLLAGVTKDFSSEIIEGR